jgi:hypothetical protein
VASDEIARFLDELADMTFVSPFKRDPLEHANSHIQAISDRAEELRESLATPAPSPPVAWALWDRDRTELVNVTWSEVSRDGWVKGYGSDRVVPLYAHPPAPAPTTDAADEPVSMCEAGCGPAATSDTEGIPLCEDCAADLNREVLREIAALVEYEGDGDIVDAVRAKIPTAPQPSARAVTEAQILAARVLSMTDAESIVCMGQADGMLVLSAVDDDGKTYALDLQPFLAALTAASEHRSTPPTPGASDAE